MRLLAIAGFVWLSLCAPAGAQTNPDRPGPWVIDVRGATVSLPRDASFFPPIPSTTAVPSRGYGVDAGGHLYLLQLGPARVGIGATWLRARGTASPGGGRASAGTPATTPDAATLLTVVGSQLSLNFGSRAGWSYLSAGLGRAQLATRASSFADEDDDDEITPARRVDHRSLSAINFGGGARWFAKPRLAFSFDVRFHVIGAGGGEAPTPGTTLLAASAGVSLR
jgi:hypothetical protein